LSGDVRRVGRHWGQVRIPKVGWVRFRWSRLIPEGVKAFRVTRDRAGRWHVAFAVAPDPVETPGNGAVIGIDRGVTVSAALATGEMLTVPGLTPGEQRRIRKLERRLARAERGSGRRSRAKTALAKLTVRETDRRKDWCEKPLAGSNELIPRSRASGARRAGWWTGSRARAKPSSAAPPATSS